MTLEKKVRCDSALVCIFHYLEGEVPNDILNRGTSPVFLLVLFGCVYLFLYLCRIKIQGYENH